MLVAVGVHLPKTACSRVAMYCNPATPPSIICLLTSHMRLFNVKFWFWLLGCMVVVVPGLPLEQLGMIWNSHHIFCCWPRGSGRAGAARDIAPGLPPQVFPRQGRRRPTPRYRRTNTNPYGTKANAAGTAVEVIEFVLVAVCSLKMVL
jgi:hypothetical protein